jgi:imidazolonepropionase-like amidohydrolase
MRTPVVLFAAALIAAVEGQPASVARDRPFVLTRVTIIDTRSGDTTREMSVSVLGSRIAAIAPTREFKPPEGFRVVDAAGRFLIPGLWDMHAHINDPELWPAHVTPAEFEAVFPVLIANGVTGVRDMGGGLEELQQWKERIRLGQLLGPRIVAAGPIVDGVFPAWQPVLSVVTEAEGRDAVRSLARRGADLIKVYDTIPREAYFAIADEAARLGIPFAGHVPELISAEEASEAGQRSIEHLSGILRTCSTLESQFQQELVKAYAERAPETPVGVGDPRLIDSFSQQKCDVLFARFVKNATWQCPTLHNTWRHAHAADPALTGDPRSRYFPKSFRAYWDRKSRNQLQLPAFQSNWQERFRATYEPYRSLVRAMHEAGVGILAGGDAWGGEYSVPGFSLHDELEELVGAGLSPLAALQAATLNPAKYFGMTESHGTVEVGRIADLVLLDANPLDDIRHTTRIAAVVVNGVFFERAALQKMLADAERAGR